MKKNLLFLALLLFCYNSFAQTNIALTAVASHTVGGATIYGPQNYNDAIITAAPATTPWGWTNTNGFIEYTWTTTQTGITKVKFWKADRPMGSCTIQYWNGSAYVTVMNYTTPITTFVDSVIFATPITTTRLRFDVVAGSSNPNHREIEVFAGPPCFGPTTMNVTNILSTSATGTWSAVSGSVGYEYLVTTTATPVFPYTTTPTTNTTANLTGLTPGTNYYLHVLNKCSATNYSGFSTYPFTTLPPCYPPTGFNVTNLTTTSATVNWSAWPSAQSYDYIIDQSNQTPTTTTGITNTLNTFAPAIPLTENTWYFVHIRSRCAANEVSGWSLDSFLTPIPCRPPVVTISNVSTDEAVASWPPVGSALFYEYAITTSPTPPAIGTKYEYTGLHASALYDGKTYYLHLRSHCNSLGIKSISEWGTTAFKTFPTSVGSAEQNIRIAAYPNPVKETLTVQVNGNRNGTGKIILTDLSGKVLTTAEVNSVKTDINMAEFAAGIYLIKYTDQSHNEIMKITKQ